MMRHLTLSVLVLLVIAVVPLATPRSVHAQEGKPAMELLQPWKGPYGGVPPWNLARPDEFVASFDAAIELARRDIDAIADDPAKATFANTIVALEDAARPLTRLSNIFDVHASNLNLGSIPDIERVVAPKLSEYEDSVTQNNKLFARIEAVYQGPEMDQLTPSQKRLVDRLYKEFVRRGAKLGDDEKKRLSQYNTRLASLFTEFSQNVLTDENGYVTWIADKQDLDGLPSSVVAAMAAAAKERGKDDQWAVTNTRSSMEPFSDIRQESGLARAGMEKLLQPGRQRRQT